MYLFFFLIVVSSVFFFFFFSSRRRHTRWTGDWSSDVCSSDLLHGVEVDSVGDDLLGHVPEGNGERRLGHAVRGQGALGAQAIFAEAIEEEIGRASCRERV